ncbi:hypothetical protein Pcinc_030098 [Petrolisthes cinctipes]|uniref:Uncharacterized protein n=1 Tax=Petrolisthes cinctipes TaxID=88211 RepID=A0AAE1K4Z1_PETCI|nr:hypothetical protein Pcinc_030098 [Petrolisthes cinctipes]
MGKSYTTLTRNDNDTGLLHGRGRERDEGVDETRRDREPEPATGNVGVSEVGRQSGRRREEKQRWKEMNERVGWMGVKKGMIQGGGRSGLVGWKVEEEEEEELVVGGEGEEEEEWWVGGWFEEEEEEEKAPTQRYPR